MSHESAGASPAAATNEDRQEQAPHVQRRGPHVQVPAGPRRLRTGRARGQARLHAYPWLAPDPGALMAETIACRGCRRPIVSEEGCALCLDFKRNLVVEGDMENVPLAKLAGDTVRLLKTD